MVFTRRGMGLEGPGTALRLVGTDCQELSWKWARDECKGLLQEVLILKKEEQNVGQLDSLSLCSMGHTQNQACLRFGRRGHGRERVDAE